MTRKFSVGTKVKPNIYNVSSKTLDNWPLRSGELVSAKIKNIVQDVRSDGRTRLFYETTRGTFLADELKRVS